MLVNAEFGEVQFWFGSFWGRGEGICELAGTCGIDVRDDGSYGWILGYKNVVFEIIEFGIVFFGVNKYGTNRDYCF